MLKTQYKGKDLFFIELEPYVGPVLLKMFMEFEMFSMKNDFLVYISGKYYKIKKLLYDNKKYSIKNKNHFPFFLEVCRGY